MSFAIEFVAGVVFWMVAWRVIDRIRWRRSTKHGK